MSRDNELPLKNILVGNSVKDKIKALKLIREESKKEYLPLLKERLVEEEGVTTTVALIETIVAIDKEGAAAKCALRLWDSHPEIRAAAISAIGKRGDEKRVRVLTRFLEDSSKKVQEQAQYWLQKRGIISSTHTALKLVTVFVFIVALVLEGLCAHLDLFTPAKITYEDVSLSQIAAEALCHKRLNGEEAFQFFMGKNDLQALQGEPELFTRFQVLSSEDSLDNLVCDDYTLEPKVKSLLEANENDKAFALLLRHNKLKASENLVLDILREQERKSSERAHEMLINAAQKGILTDLAAARKLLEK